MLKHYEIFTLVAESDAREVLKTDWEEKCDQRKFPVDLKLNETHYQSHRH